MKSIKKDSGFTLIELLITSIVLLVSLSAIIVAFYYAFGLMERGRNMTLSFSRAENIIEEIRATAQSNFSSVVSQYKDRTFGTTPSNEIPGMRLEDSEGMIEIDNSNPDLLVVTVSVSWREKSGRIIGEDINLDGSFDPTTEDLNNNGRMDSPVQIVTSLARR